MSLDPRDRKSWHGFLDLMQPPAGYRLSAALGTTFGLTIEAMTAALLAMSDTDGEALASEPIAGVMAITRMRSRVRVMVHPATIAGNFHAGSSRFVALLDRMIVQVDPGVGLFHPKVWALRFDKVAGSQSGEPEAIGRMLVGSRNLSNSTSFELGTVFEGTVTEEGARGSQFSGDVADALQEWLKMAKEPVPDAVSQLPSFLRRLSIDTPHEAGKRLRFHWQGQRRESLGAVLPRKLERVVVVSPFVRPDFISRIAERTGHLQIVSLPESFDALDDETFGTIEELRKRQGSPVLYQVTEHGEPEGGQIDGIHAKLVLIEEDGGQSATFVGSANATGAGWGLGGRANIEAMAEMRPGIGIDHFVHGFLREDKTKVHPWIMEYDRESKQPPDVTMEAERRMLAALREVARFDLELRYEAKAERLNLSCKSWESLARIRGGGNADLHFDVCPLLLREEKDGWRPIEQLADGVCHFERVTVEKLTAFVVLRVRSSEPPLEHTRLLLARLAADESDIDRRDDAIRQDIMATADPAAVLNALVRGIAHLRMDRRGSGRNGGGKTPSMRQLLGDTSLERLLQAVAVDSGLIVEMRLLLGSIGGSHFQRLCDDLEAVVRQVHEEAAP